MIERTIIGYLKNTLNLPAYAEVPEYPPRRFVLVEKTGGARPNYIWNATLAVQSYGESMEDTMELNEQVKAAMFAAPAELSSVSAVRLNSDYNWTDPDTKKYRYQAVFDVVHY